MNDLTTKIRARRSRALKLSVFLGCSVALSACGSTSDPGTKGGAGSPGSAGSVGTTAGAGGGALPGGGASSGGALGSSGVAGTAPGGAGQAGAAGAVVTSDVAITTHPIALTAGKAFNVAEDLFDDGFIPPSPLANFGFQTPIVPVAHADGSLDVAFLDYTNGKGKPMALPALGMIYITHIEPTLSTGTTVATGIQSYRLLGFTMDPSGAFYVAYTADHPFKNDTKDDANNVQGNELRIAKSATPDFTNKAWDSLVFGDQDNTKDKSKGNAGAAGSGVLAFDTTNQMLVGYVAHQMAWADDTAQGFTRHQAGYFGLFDPATGKQTSPGGNSTQNTGAGWFYSHNFDQRLLVDGGISYVLAHGDAYDRQLGFAAWSLDSYTKKNGTTFNQSYFTIAGNEGDNQTDTETGQFIKLSDGRFVIIHTTSQTRTARDVRIVLADGTTGATTSEAWLTTNTGNIQATTPKVEVLGDKLFVSYGLWDSTSRTNKKIDWYSLLLGLDLKPVGAAKAAPNVEFVTSSPLFRFAGGPSAGSVGWVSGNAMHTLSVNVASSAP
ncbi:MAG: hypothetical protein ABUL62_07430 [Myxococcales bacterium]